MAATAGHTAAISGSTDDTTYNAIVGMDSVQYSDDNELLDITSFDIAGIRAFIQGLQSGSFQVSGFWESSTGQNAVRAAKTSGADHYLRILFDGTNGFKLACKIESISTSVTVAGRVEFSFSARFNAAPTAVP